MVSGVSQAFWQALDFQTIRQPSQNNLVGKWRPLKQMVRRVAAQENHHPQHGSFAHCSKPQKQCDGSPPIDTERPKPRNLEPNREEMYPPKSRPRHSLVRSGPRRSFWSRGPSRVAEPLCPTAPEHALNTGAYVENRGRGRPVMPSDSVWLCSTHPETLPDHVPGWLAPIRQACDSAEIALERREQPEIGDGPVAWSARKTGRPPAAVGTQSR